jgi:Rad3-related DNA helicase
MVENATMIPEGVVLEARKVRFLLRQCIQLKQGVGRLLRADDDRGVMAILDVRLHTRGYGKSVLGSLPPAPLVTGLEEVEHFFSTH